MLGTKRIAVALATVAVGAVAPSMASAGGTWTTGGAVFSGAMSAQAHGSLTVVPTGGSVRTTCDVTMSLTLSNHGGLPTPDGHLTVGGVTFQNCVTNIPGCGLVATASGSGSTLPWTGAGDAATQQIALGVVHLVEVFDSGCPGGVAGATHTWMGVVGPMLDSPNQLLSFDGTAATGTLSNSAGTAHIDGDLSITAPADLGLV